MIMGLCKECSTYIGLEDRNKEYSGYIYQCPNCGTLHDISEIEPYENFIVKERKPKRRNKFNNWD